MDLDQLAAGTMQRDAREKRAGQGPGVGTVNAGADNTQFGFSGSTIAFTGNMFDFTTGNYDFAEAQFADKATMQKGLPVTPSAFTQFNAGGVLVDTVQPVEIKTTAANDPGVQYLVSSFNMSGDPFGDNSLTTACQGFVVWAFDPASQSISGTFTGTAVPNPTDIVPPNADQPGCLQCVETIDARITATPVYSVGSGEGLISFSLDTGVSNGEPIFPNIVSGLLWGKSRWFTAWGLSWPIASRAAMSPSPATAPRSSGR